MAHEYVQFGCGLCAPQSWRNFDAGPAFWLERRLPFLKPMLLRRGYPNYPENIEYGNVIEGLPVDPETAKAVYCSHVLEHMALEEFRATLRNVFTYLQSGGVFRFVLPDMEFMAKAYLADTRTDAVSHFMEDTYLGEKSLTRGVGAMPRALFGRGKHFWMWDEKGITQELAAAGFVSIRRAQIGDNPDPHFKDVEDNGRWENCLGMECRKP